MLLREEVKAKAGLWQRIQSRPLPLKWYRRLTVATAGAIWLLIVLGGLVRVTESGEGCGNSWPMCHGHLLPNLEYHELVEWNHRLIAFLVGWLMVLTIGVTVLWYRRPRRLLWMALIAGVTYVLQAVLGGLTVLFHVGHTWSALHMGNSMFLVAATFLLATFARTSVGSPESRVQSRESGVQSLRANSFSAKEVQDSKSRMGKRRFRLWTPDSGLLKWLALGTVAWTYIALFSGSAVIGADATLACPSWPECSATQLLPATDLQWVNFTHRLAVGLSDVMLLGLAIAIWRTRRHDRRLMNSVHILGVLYISQVFLGAFTIWLSAPAAIRGAHLALAAATWGTLVVMTTFLWMSPASKGQRPESGGDGGNSPESRVPSPESKEVAEREQVGAGKVYSYSSKLANKGYFSSKFQNSKLKIYLELMRPHVIPLLIIPTIASMLIAAVQHPPERNLLELILWTTLGGTLATGGAHAINQYIDRDIDAKMRRTKRRAVVTGKISPQNALNFGIGLTVISVVQLWLTVNLTAAALSLAGNLFYVFVYTLWLKRTTTQNIVIGGAAGAVPPLVGWAAVTGGVGLPAILFFAIIFFWTPAHFWALALVRQEDYAAAGVPMLPVVKGEVFTRQNILFYAVLLVAVTLLPFGLHALGWLYLVTAAGLGAVFVFKAIKLLRGGTQMRAWRLFKFSNTYLAALYAMMVIDRLFALGGL